ncbi:MAG: prepilin-type N-terminal cleavage/methylation domain-containing protein [Gammaproteobacteria bacterium]|nr:prepilin-type N-terminal cleavage/methylation domain-containing protein [Gammaproteobacteria bacterium]MDJ0871837.1 prepilin-type N-terminal cleavage/methylation domain-containing protein [Gammaproteobacteria bacterium]
MSRSCAGFTLLELAVVLVVLGLLLGGLLMPLATQVDVARIRETNDALDKVEEALLGFAIANGNRLPCPASDELGLEDCSVAVEGFLPWRTLGVGRYDAWGRTFRYRPDGAYVAAVGFPPDTTSGLEVRDRAGTVLTAADPNAPAAIIFSTGKNVEADAGNKTPPSDEIYTQGVYAEDTFDDILVWLSKNTMVSRLAAAGTWPP